MNRHVRCDGIDAVDQDGTIIQFSGPECSICKCKDVYENLEQV